VKSRRLLWFPTGKGALLLHALGVIAAGSSKRFQAPLSIAGWAILALADA
jgi:hypothetical protein